jgi:hypothetical protein
LILLLPKDYCAFLGVLIHMLNMKALARRRLAIFLSLFMTLFLMCQGQAMASGLAGSVVTVDPIASGMDMNCQQPDKAASHGDLSTKSACPAGCLHLPSHSQINAFDLPTVHLFGVVLVFLFPQVVQDANTISWSSLPFHDPLSDPPIPIHYQRLNE